MIRDLELNFEQNHLHFSECLVVYQMQQHHFKDELTILPEINVYKWTILVNILAVKIIYNMGQLGNPNF